MPPKRRNRGHHRFSGSNRTAVPAFDVHANVRHRCDTVRRLVKKLVTVSKNERPTAALGLLTDEVAENSRLSTAGGEHDEARTKPPSPRTIDRSDRLVLVGTKRNL